MNSETQTHSMGEYLLLKWIQIIFIAVCAAIMLFLIIVAPLQTIITNRYVLLIIIEIVLLAISLALLNKNRFNTSARILVIAGIIGPWGAALIDESVVQGNLLPLVYVIIPIFLSSFFTLPKFTLLVGFLQIIGLGIFFTLSDVKLSASGTSLFYFVIFVFATSIVYGIQNRSNRSLIHTQMHELNEMATHDQLTGLYNRHFLNEYFRKELARLERSGGILSVIILDIDNFKSYNDTYGHECGDLILVGLSEILVESFRETDVICRFGGDEFMVVMTGSNKTQARTKCVKLASEISKRSFCTLLAVKEPVRISAGISSYPVNGMSPNKLIKSADNALLHAKKNGKDRIKVAR